MLLLKRVNPKWSEPAIMWWTCRPSRSSTSGMTNMEPSCPSQSPPTLPSESPSADREDALPLPRSTIFLAVSCNPFKLVARSLIDHSYLLVSRRHNGSSSCPAGPTESLIIDFWRVHVFVSWLGQIAHFSCSSFFTIPMNINRCGCGDRLMTRIPMWHMCLGQNGTVREDLRCIWQMGFQQRHPMGKHLSVIKCT